VQESTSPEAAGKVVSRVATFFTIANPKEAQQILAQVLARAADRGLLTSGSTEVLTHLAAKYGPQTPAPLKSRRGRRKGQRSTETVELERRVLEVRAELLDRGVFKPSTKEIIEELAKKKVPLPRSWRKGRMTSWSRVLSNTRYRRLAAKRFSKIKGDVRPGPINSAKF
jgi:hypothetical protein